MSAPVEPAAVLRCLRQQPPNGSAAAVGRVACAGVTDHSQRAARPRVGVAMCSQFCYDCFVARTIPQRELRNDNAAVINAVASGQSFVVTRNGVPVAELRPLRSGRRTVIPKAELIVLAAAGPHIDLERFRDDLDRIVDQDL